MWRETSLVAKIGDVPVWEKEGVSSVQEMMKPSDLLSLPQRHSKVLHRQQQSERRGEARPTMSFVTLERKGSNMAVSGNSEHKGCVSVYVSVCVCRCVQVNTRQKGAVHFFSVLFFFFKGTSAVQLAMGSQSSQYQESVTSQQVRLYDARPNRAAHGAEAQLGEISALMCNTGKTHTFT